MRADGRSDRALLRALVRSEATSAEAVVRTVEEITGRRIRVRAVPELKGEVLCGAWIGLADADLLFHVPTESSLSREQIIFHELGHIVLKHEGESHMAEYVADLVPDLPRGAVVRALARGNFQDASERAAETYADEVAAIVRDNRRGRTQFARVFS